MILGLFWLVVANAASFIGARVLVQRVRSDVNHIRVLLFLLFRFALISGLILLAGMTGCLSSTRLGLACAGALALMLAFGRPERLDRPCLDGISPVVLGLFGIVAFRLLLQVWVFPPYDYDAISYHLPKIAEWVRAERFTREMGIDTHVPFPAGFELIETWWVVFLHHDVLIELAGVEFLVLAGAATFSLARQVGLNPQWSLMASLFFILTPGLHLCATACLNDCPTAAIYLSAAALVVARSPVGLLLLPLGLGIGIKPTFGYAIPGLLVLWVMMRGQPAGVPDRKRLPCVLGATGLLIGSFWYVRNAVWFGSPIYPVGTAGLVGRNGILKIQFGPSLTSALRSLRDLVDSRIYDGAYYHTALLRGNSGWGSLAVACGLVSLLVGLRESGLLRKVTASFAISTVCVLALVNYDPWCFRFVYFFPAVLCIAVARLAERSRGVQIVASIGLFFVFLTTMISGEVLLNENFQSLWRQSWRDRTVKPFPQGWDAVEGVAYYVFEPEHNRGEAYALYGPGLSRRVVFLKGSTLDEVIAEMEASRVSLLYVARTSWPCDVLERVGTSPRFATLSKGFYQLRQP
jgi:hypothetical protein